MGNPIADLVRISRELGQDIRLTQGNGGNTSTKTDDGKYMYVKTAGIQLKDMTAGTGWRKLDLDLVRAIFTDKTFAALDELESERRMPKYLEGCCVDGAELSAAPSSETPLHAVLPKYAAHLHPLALTPYICSKNGKEALEGLLGGETSPPLWIPYALGGYSVGKKIWWHVASYERRHGKPPWGLFLQNHGLVVTAENPRDLLKRVHSVIEKCRQNLKWPRIKQKPVPAERIQETRDNIERALGKVTEDQAVAGYLDDPMVTSLAAMDDAQELAEIPALLPVEIAYGGPAVWLNDGKYETIRAALERQPSRKRRVPCAFLVKDMGLFVAGAREDIPDIGEVTKVALLSRKWVARFGGADPLTKRYRDIIEALCGFR